MDEYEEDDQYEEYEEEAEYEEEEHEEEPQLTKDQLEYLERRQKLKEIERQKMKKNGLVMASAKEKAPAKDRCGTLPGLPSAFGVCFFNIYGNQDSFMQNLIVVPFLYAFAFIFVPLFFQYHCIFFICWLFCIESQW